MTKSHAFDKAPVAKRFSANWRQASEVVLGVSGAIAIAIAASAYFIGGNPGTGPVELILCGFGATAVSLATLARYFAKDRRAEGVRFGILMAEVALLYSVISSYEIESGSLPTEFAFIPLVESWYRPEAIGSNGPSGMWQMIGSTARNHGVHIQPGYDGRLSPVESTRAALSYLKTLQQMFGDWQTIVMAYNAGEGRIQKAFKRSRSREASAALRRPHGLSNITYDYVAKLQALACLVSDPQRNGLALPESARFVPVVPVLADDKLDSLEEFARRQDQDPKQLRRLNPGFRNGRIVAGVPRLVLTPVVGWQSPSQDRRQLLANNTEHLAGVPDELANAATEPQVVIVHEVQDGDSLWSIARRYGMNLEFLRRINQLGKRAVVHPGQKLKLSP